jgi:glycosyltransferase involved in cell wall biosynthesis
LNVGGRIEFVGKVPFDEVPRYLKAADLFCFASVTETQGLVTMEAMAAGLPVVAVDATGTSDIVDNGVDGLLTANDSQALAEAIERVLADEDLRQRLRQAGTDKIKRFDMKVLAERLVEVYQQAIVDKRAGRAVVMDEQKPIFQINWQKFFGIST